MKFEFTHHARERCRQRGIKFRDVRLVIQSPDKFNAASNGVIEAAKKIRGQVLVVLFDVKREVRKIITAYYED